MAIPLLPALPWLAKAGLVGLGTIASYPVVKKVTESIRTTDKPDFMRDVYIPMVQAQILGLDNVKAASDSTRVAPADSTRVAPSDSTKTQPTPSPKKPKKPEKDKKDENKTWTWIKKAYPWLTTGALAFQGGRELINTYDVVKQGSVKTLNDRIKELELRNKNLADSLKITQDELDD